MGYWVPPKQASPSPSRHSTAPFFMCILIYFFFSLSENSHNADHNISYSLLCFTHLICVRICAKGNILALQMPVISRWMALKGIALELREFGYKTTVVLPADQETEKSMTDLGMDFIVSEGLTQYNSIFKNVSKDIINHGFSGITGFVPSAQDFNKFCPYLVDDSVLMEILRKRKFDAAVIDTIFVNLCTSVIPYKLSIPFIHFRRSFQLQQLSRSLVPSS